MQQSTYIREIHFSCDLSGRKQFRSGRLCNEWTRKYPQLFDEEDCRIFESRWHRRYPFYECLVAILFYETFGYISLLEKYGALVHTRKTKVFTAPVSAAVFNAAMKDQRGAPDLFVCSPETGHWLFCEVKGPGDRIGKHQRRHFKRLFKASGKPVYVVWLHDAEE